MNPPVESPPAHALAGSLAPSLAHSLAQDPELIADFILESRGHLANIENRLLTLERDGPDAEAWNAVFRGFHTIKGLAGFLDLGEMLKLAHEVETVLDAVRNGAIAIAADGFDVILASADYLAQWLAHLEAGAYSYRPRKSPGPMNRCWFVFARSRRQPA